MSETDPRPELEIKSDADWKRQVKDEAAQLDAQRQQAAQNAGESDQTADQTSSASPASPEATAPGGPAGELPPADFTMLVTMFSTQAMVFLGVLPNPETGEPAQNLPLARHFIDLLGLLQEKTRRNLTGNESDLLENSLHELRLAYLEISKSAASSPSSDSPPTDAPT